MLKENESSTDLRSVVSSNSHWGSNYKTLVILIVLIFIFRLFISQMPAFEYDQNAFRFWSQRLAEGGLANFYSPDTFTNNPIGFLYLLWLMAQVKINFLAEIITQNNQYDILLKIPANVADLATASLIYFFLKKKASPKVALAGFLLYALNPALIFNSAIWGQYDAIASMFLLLSIFAVTVKKTPEVATVFFALALSFKPQTIAFAPIFGLLLLTQSHFKRWIFSAIAFFITALLIYFPFFPDNPIQGIIYVNSGSTALFNCTTCFALNFWGMFGNWQNDSQKFYGLSFLVWGLILFVIASVTVFFIKPLKKILQEPILYLVTALSIFSFFIFLTRMHERYLFPFFPFMLLAALLIKSRFLIIIYLLTSILYLLNLYIPYVYYNNELSIKTFPIDLSPHFQFFSVVAVIIFTVFYLYCLRLIGPLSKQDGK